MNLDRRGFLGLGAAVVAGAGFQDCNASLDTSGPRPCPPGSWRKGPIVLGAPGAPEGPQTQNFTCTAEPLDGGRWRIWYSQSSASKSFNLGVAEGIPGEPMVRHEAVLSTGEPADAPLAIGHLPEGWRPVQGVHVSLPDGRHRLYFWVHGPGVGRYLAADSTDGRRYRVVDPGKPCLYHPNDRAVEGKAAAEAGLRRLANRPSRRPANEAPAPARLITNDAANVYRLPDGTFELYVVGLFEVAKDDPRSIAHDNAAGWIRVIDRFSSDDGLNWADRRRVIVPDADDPTDQQFYYLSVTHTDRGRVGMLGHYRVEAQTVDLEWCFSTDGILWERPLRRAWIPRGQGDAPDSEGIYAPNSLVHSRGEWHLFYTGVNYLHNGKQTHGKPANVVRLATTASIWN